MTDTTNPTAPAVSEQAWAFYAGMLKDERFKAEHPERYAALEKSVRGAMAVTGRQSLEPQPVQTTAAQHHEAKFGVNDREPGDYENIAARDFNLGEGNDPAEFADGARIFASALRLPPVLARVVADQVAAAPDDIDPEGVRQAVEQVGHRYDDLIRDVDALIRDGERRLGGGKIEMKAKDLPPHALVQLALWARHVARMNSTAPRG